MDRLVRSTKTFPLRTPVHYLVAGWVAWCTGMQLANAEVFPYVAYVTGDDAYVRSGPGQRYYPTSQLPPGFAVEVYRHEADGWCAVRPPEGSFSWVASHQVRQIDPTVVEIVDDNVVTRVGSMLSPSRTAVQVLLPKGERVELLPATEDEDPRWVRVAPPAGEFRWIAADALSRQAPMEVQPKTDSSLPTVSNPAGTGWSRRSELTKASVDTEQQSDDSRMAVADLRFEKQLPKPAQQTVVKVPVDPNAMDIVAGSPAELQLAQFQTQPAPTVPLQSTAAPLPTPIASQPTAEVAQAIRPRVRFRGLSANSTVAINSIEELELQLSQNVVKPPTEWQLEPLEVAANSLLADTKNPPLKAQLRDVLARINRFQEVKEGYTNPGPTIVPMRDPFESTAEVAPADAAPERELTGLSADVRERVQEDLDAEGPVAARTPPAARVQRPLYDATGLLKPVVSQRNKAPQYALVDEQGKVVSFITPTPELDLKPYLGRRIGVHGDRGYMPEYRRAHVTAGRVTPIESGTIRR